MKYLVVLCLFFSVLSSYAQIYPITSKPNPFSGSRLYLPNDQARHTSIVMLHGSEGGSKSFIDSEASVLATLGYNVLVFCYFDCNRGITGTGETLKNVEVSKILDAVRWLRDQTQSNGKVAVYGFSRGAELTMLVGSLKADNTNHPDALIAHSPSDVFNGPWNWSWRDYSCWLCKAGINQCSENSANEDFQWNPSCGPDDPNKIDFSVSSWIVFGSAVKSETRIEIEKYIGPILITVGNKDEVWPVEQTQRIEMTLKAAGKNPEVHYFPNQGHGFIGQDEFRRRELVINFLQRIP